MFRPLDIPHRFTGAHVLGVMLVAVVAMLACGSVWSQAPSGVPPGSAFTPVAPTTRATSASPATINSGDAAPMGTYPGSPAGVVAPASLSPTLSNPINRNPATRAAVAAPPAPAGSTTLGSPATSSSQGFSSPPASRDTLVAPDPSRDGMPGAL